MEKFFKVVGILACIGLVGGGIWYGVAQGFASYRDSIVREQSRSFASEGAQLQAERNKAEKERDVAIGERDAARAEVAAGTEAKKKSDAIVAAGDAEHRAFAAIVIGVCGNYEIKAYMKGTLDCRQDGVTAGKTAYEFVRDANGNIKDLIPKPVVQPTLQGNAAQAANR